MAGGSGRIYAHPDETFPLNIPYDDITILGTRARHPVIDPLGAETLDPEAVILIDGRSGCRLERLWIRAGNYNLDGTGTNEEDGLHGVLVRDLPSGGSLSIDDCEIHDLWNGVFFSDDLTFTPTSMRLVNITDTKVTKCGPWIQTASFDRGHAGIRLLEAKSSWIDLRIDSCVLNDNHDALEPGEARLLLTDTDFNMNENGLEYAVTPGGTAYVIGCSFTLHERFDPDFGGVSASTAAVSTRYEAGYDLTVRNSDFEDNQFAVFLKGGVAGDTGTIDLGSTNEPLIMNVDNYYSPPLVYPAKGGNVFTMDTQAPWYPNEDYRVSYCALFNGLDTAVLAVGNTWTYADISNCSVADCNQGANTSGQFPDDPLSSMTIDFGTNFDLGTLLPPHRPLSTAPPSAPNVPWNFGTGTEIDYTQMPPVSTGAAFPSGNPTILLEP